MMLVFSVLIAAAVAYHTMPPGACVYGLAFVLGPVLYVISVWIAVIFAIIVPLAIIELVAFMVGGVMRLLLP